MIDKLKAYLVDDWRQCLKWSSVRLHIVVVLLNALFMAMPALDPSIAAILPKAFQSPAIGIYGLLALVFRITKLRANG